MFPMETCEALHLNPGFPGDWAQVAPDLLQVVLKSPGFHLDCEWRPHVEAGGPSLVHWPSEQGFPGPRPSWRPWQE